MKATRCGNCRDEAMASSAAASQPALHAAPTLPQRAAHHGLVSAVAAEAPAFAATAALAVRWATTWRAVTFSNGHRLSFFRST